MKNINNLSEIKVGHKAKVISIEIEGNMRRRLLDIGLTNGAVIECLFKSPFDDPSAFLIKGAVIALRKEECEKIKTAIDDERVS